MSIDDRHEHHAENLHFCSHWDHATFSINGKVLLKIGLLGKLHYRQLFAEFFQPERDEKF